jgi:hypothetical protein
MGYRKQVCLEMPKLTTADLVLIKRSRRFVWTLTIINTTADIKAIEVDMGMITVRPSVHMFLSRSGIGYICSYVVILVGRGFIGAKRRKEKGGGWQWDWRQLLDAPG